MATVRELVTRLGFEVEEKGLKKFEDGIAGVKGGLLGMGALLVTTGGSLFALIGTAAKAASQITSIAASAGVSAEALQKLAYAGSLSGAGMDDLGIALKFLSRNIYEATHEQLGPAAQKFRALHVQFTTAAGKGRQAADVFKDISARFHEMKDPTEKAALAIQLFGRGGGAVVKMLNKGPEFLREMGEELEAFGGVLNDTELKNLAEFKQSLTRLFRIFTAIKDQLAAGLAPAFTAIIVSIRKFVIANKEVIKTNITGFIKASTDYLRILWKVVEGVTQLFTSFSNALGGTERASRFLLVTLTLLSAASILVGLLKLGEGIWALFTAVTAFDFSLIAIPALIVAIIAAIGLLLNDIKGFGEGKDSVFGKFAESFPLGAKVIVDALASIRSAISDTFDVFKKFHSFSPLALAYVTGKGIYGAGKSFFEGGSITGPPASGSSIVNRGSQGASVTVGEMPMTFIFGPGIDPLKAQEAVSTGINDGLNRVLRETEQNSSPAGAR